MTVPTKAIEAAEQACPDEHISLGHWERKLNRAEMLKVLEAAAPHIVEAERQRIRQLAHNEATAYRKAGADFEARTLRIFADLLDGDADG